MDSFVAGKHLFLGDFLGLILLGFLKLNILGMAPGFRVFRPIPKLTRISSALKWCSQTKYFWIHHKDWSCHLLLFSDTLKLYLSIFSFPYYLPVLTLFSITFSVKSTSTFCYATIITKTSRAVSSWTFFARAVTVIFCRHLMSCLCKDSGCFIQVLFT